MIPILWRKENMNADHRSRYGACTNLNEMLDLYHCEHHREWAGMTGDKAVVVVHGGNQRDEVEEVNREIAHLKGVIVIGIGDEESAFPYERIEHPNKIVWCQTPRVYVHADRFYPHGYPNDCMEMVAKHRSDEKKYDWVFAGQVTHYRRQECAAVLRKMPRGVLVESNGFGKGIDHDNYFDYMCRARVVPCPSGPETPESYRVYEAIEAGAVPIVDRTSPKGGLGYWTKVFGKDCPLIEIEDWNNFPAVLNTVLVNWQLIQPEVYQWWYSWKMNFRTWLAKDWAKLDANLPDNPS